MYGKIRVNLIDVVMCLSELTDIAGSELSRHHKKVAYIAHRIGESLNIPKTQRKDLVLAGLLHDIGAFSTEERRAILLGDEKNIHNHGIRGANLLQDFTHLRPASKAIKYHHVNWNNGEGAFFNGEEVDEKSHILHLADKVAILVKDNHNILAQSKTINEQIKSLEGKMFKKEHVEAFLSISMQEQLWLDIVYDPILTILPDMLSIEELMLDLNEQIDIAKIFANIIDFRSPFTANHSRGVAASAEHLARLMNFSPIECQMILIAGYLHDLGKVAVTSEILEKPATLNVDEFSVMRSHPYYTYRVLNKIKALQTITEWAAFHHERMDGTGYPFRLKGDELSLGARIMAVVDVFTAVSEDRPYRSGIEKAKAIKILKIMEKNNALCSNVTSVMLDNFDEINDTRIMSQRKSQKDYEKINK